jgi:hypothetical protein
MQRNPQFNIGALAVFQFKDLGWAFNHSVRVNMEAYRKVWINILSFVAFFTPSFAFILFAVGLWEVALVTLGVGILVTTALLLIQPMRVLKKVAVRQQSIIDGDLREAFVTSYEYSNQLVFDDEGQLLQPPQDAMEFLALSDVISADRKLGRKIKPNTLEHLDHLNLQLWVINIACETFENVAYLDELREIVLRARSMALGAIKNMHLENLDTHYGNVAWKEKDPEGWNEKSRKLGEHGKLIGKIADRLA